LKEMNVSLSKMMFKFFYFVNLENIEFRKFRKSVLFKTFKNLSSEQMASYDAILSHLKLVLKRH
jgi:hypothetical protein